MSGEKLPYYKRYPRDYLSDENVAMMTLEEEGAYNRLMDYCWLHGSIPSDLGRMARLCQVGEAKMRELWPALEPCFDEDGDRYTHPRMEKERSDAKSRSEAARKAAHARWSNRKSKSDKDTNATALQPHSEDRAEPHSGNMPYTEAEADTEADSSSGDSLPTVENTPGEDAAVENSPDEEDEPWNARLAPLIRDVAYDGRGPPPNHSLGRCLDKARELMGKGYSVEDLEDAIRGLRRMAERKHRAIRDWIEPGDRFTMLAFGRAEEKGQKLVQLAAHEWRRGERASRGDGGMEKLQVSA